MALSDIYDSPLGQILMTAEGDSLTGLWFSDRAPEKAVSAPRIPDHGSYPESRRVFDETRAWLDTYFSGKDPGKAPKLAPEGTEFRRKVWDILLTIPYGETLSYGAVARELAAQSGIPVMSAQAVGGAVGHNPISIIIPCHRVIGSDGSLVGYGGGLDRKVRLLSMEQAGDR